MAWHPTWNEPPQDEGRYRYVRMKWGTSGRATGMYALLILTCVVYLFFQSQPGALGRAVENWGVLTARSVIYGGQVWRLVTFQFLHGSFDHIFWNMFGLWMFGRIVEMQIGTRRFVWLYLLCGVAGGLAECAFNYILVAYGYPPYANIPIVGASAGVMGVVIAYAVRNPNAVILLFFILPMRAKWLAVGYFVITTVMVFTTLKLGGQLGHGPMVAHAAHLGGMIYAVLWMLATGQIDSRLGRKMHRLFTPAQPSGGESASGVYRAHPVVRGPNAGRNVSRDASSEEELRLDAVLRKIHDHGLDSLSDEERRFLRTMSERRREEDENR